MDKISFKEKPLILILVATLCSAGGFYSPVAFCIGLAIIILLALKMFKNGELYISKNINSVFALVLAGGFLATALWGVDKYNSILGFVRMLPILLFSLYASQLDRQSKDEALGVIAPLGAIMTIVSFPLSKLDSIAHLFSVSGRISGFFEYSNTFALFLILGIITIAFKEKLDLYNCIMLAILLLGVFLTGSRTSFVILALAIVALVISSKNKRFKISVCALFAFLIIAGAIVFAITGRYGAFARFLTISSSSGTLLGRLLYFKDAIKVIAGHPFGLGYMGYYFMQGTFQTGVYANQFVHNELLQLALDIGWIPLALGVACIVKAFVSRSITLERKIMLATILLHSMMDFDLQYLGIVFIVILLVDFEEKRASFKLSKGVGIAIASVLSIIVLSTSAVALSDFAYLTGSSKKASDICSSNTMAQIDNIELSTSTAEKNSIADIIISNNKYISNSYSVKALYYYEQGSIDKAIEYKKKAIECNRYFADEYSDYSIMLINAISMYVDMNDYDSASYCCEALLDLDKQIDELNKSTDKIAYKLQDKPDVSLPKECQDYISELKALN